MRVCVDTTILLDILKDEFRSFQDKLYAALVRREKLVAPPVVFAELMPQFKGNTRQLHEFLEEHKIAIEPLDVDSVIAAAQAWMRYLKRKTKVKCPQCGQKLNLKEHLKTHSAKSACSLESVEKHFLQRSRVWELQSSEL